MKSGGKDEGRKRENDGNERGLKKEEKTDLKVKREKKEAEGMFRRLKLKDVGLVMDG